MTCILATPQFMMADRRVTDTETGEIGSLVKIAKNKHVIAAAAGNATSTLAVVRAIRKGAQSAEDLIEHVDKASIALCLTPDGRIVRIEQGVLWDCRALEAIGSGADLALGYVTGVGEKPPSEALVRRAIRFAGTRRMDVGGGADVRRFPP